MLPARPEVGKTVDVAPTLLVSINFLLGPAGMLAKAYFSPNRSRRRSQTFPKDVVAELATCKAHCG